MLATGALGVFNTALAYYVYFRLVHEEGPTFACLNNYIAPVIGVVGGAVALAVPIAPSAWAGLALALAWRRPHRPIATAGKSALDRPDRESHSRRMKAAPRFPGELPLRIMSYSSSSICRTASARRSRGAVKARGRGWHAGLRKIDNFLPSRLGYCYCFSERLTDPARASHGRRATWAFGVKSREGLGNGAASPCIAVRGRS